MNKPLFIHWGSIIVSNGAPGKYTDNKLWGNPYGISYSLAQATQDEEYESFIQKSLEETLCRIAQLQVS